MNYVLADKRFLNMVHLVMPEFPTTFFAKHLDHNHQETLILGDITVLLTVFNP